MGGLDFSQRFRLRVWLLLGTGDVGSLGRDVYNRIRALALGLSATVNWLANFVISTTFPVFLESSGPSLTYGFYATAAAISFFFVLIMVRENKGRELEDMV